MHNEKNTDFSDLENGMSLKDVSAMLDIPSSTLRYWDKQGLVKFERNWQNDYRQVSMNTLMNLLDVLDFREMDIPIEKIKQTPEMKTNELLTLLAESQQEMLSKMAKLQQILAKIDLKQQALRRIEQLENTPPSLVYRQMPAIFRVNIKQTTDVKNYFAPMQGADLLHAKDKEQWLAGMWKKTQSGDILRSADSQAMPYLNGLLRFGRDEKDNRDEIINIAYTMGFQPNQIIAQYLSSAYHPEFGLCDYLECWVELNQAYQE